MPAASRKVGFVLLINGEPKDWGLSVKASRSPEFATAYVDKLIQQYQPDCVVTEQITKYSRKSPENIANIRAFSKAITDQQSIEIERSFDYANKYEEIATLAEQFPQLAQWAVPKRKIWLGEHRNTIIFEALSMAIQLEQPPTNLPT